MHANNNIDDFSKNKFDAFDAGKENMANDWEKMRNELDSQQPKPKLKKRITKRIIKYMGLTALITTVTYFAYKNKNSQHKVLPATQTVANRKNMYVAPQQKNNYASIAQPIILSNSIKINLPKRKNPNVSQTIIRQTSDTVFQHKNIPQHLVKTNDSLASLTVKNVYAIIKKPTQIFTINPERDTLLFGMEGSVLKIPSYIFMSMDNKIVKTPIKVELTECFTYADMLSNGLTTTSEGSQLVSGGMLKIEAFAEGRELKLSGFRSIALLMPMEKYDPQMQLYKGVPANVSSQKNDSLFLNKNIQQPPVNWLPAAQVQAYVNPDIFRERQNITIMQFRQELKSEKEKYFGHFTIVASDKLKDEQLKDMLQRKFYQLFERITIDRVKKFDAAIVAKSTKAMATENGFVAVDSIAVDFKKAVKEKWISSKDSLQFILMVNAERKLFKEKATRDSIAYIKRKEFEKAYSFDISGLGWINCDRIFDYGKPRIEFSLKVEEGMESALGDYKMIFTNLKSILPGKFFNGEIYFGSVPLDEPVKIICVAPKNGKAMGCIKSFKISRQEMGVIKFEAITPQSFKEQLLKL